MSPSDVSSNTQPGERKVKTLAIRLPLELHAQLGVIAQLRGSTVTDEIRAALTAHVASQASSPDLAGSATEMLEEIERDAASRREALSALFGQTEGTPPKARRSRSEPRPSTDEPAA